jgi:hypothetical protein
VHRLLDGGRVRSRVNRLGRRIGSRLTILNHVGKNLDASLFLEVFIDLCSHRHFTCKSFIKLKGFPPPVSSSHAIPKM